MKISVFADLHYFGADIKTAVFNTERKLVQYALPLLDRFIDITNHEFCADVCVNLGDLIQDTQEKAGDLECFAFVFGKLSKLNCPCHSVLGNHDLKMMDHVSDVEAVMGHKSTYSVDIEGYHLVFLTTEVRPELGIEHGGCYKAQYLADETIDWLKKDLDNNTLPCLVFTHYLLAEDESVKKERMFMKNRAEVKEILKSDKNLLAVFSGHCHRTKLLVEDGVKYYVLGSLTGCPKEDGIPEGHYYEIEVNDRELEVELKKVEL